MKSYSDTRLELTPRMRAVLRCAAAGKTTPETALELGIAPSTARDLRAAALERLGAPTIAAAVATAIRGGQL